MIVDQSEKKMRRVRSFMRRDGRISELQRHALNEILPKYVLSLTNGKQNTVDMFGRTGDLYIEIGFGNGQVLLDLAERYPENNYIGIEVYNAGIASLMLGVERLGLENVRVFCVDAVDVFRSAIDERSVNGVMLYFPDPWPKMRHHKRRLVQQPFIDLVASRLTEGGFWHMATDWQNYAEHMMKEMSARQDFMNASGTGLYYIGNTARPLTRFEQKGFDQGHITHELLFLKK
jgi:tRNA (guanine-N7-)-methyltransferase